VANRGEMARIELVEQLMRMLFILIVSFSGKSFRQPRGLERRVLKK
jgi:hypothetical protein